MLPGDVSNYSYHYELGKNFVFLTKLSPNLANKSNMNQNRFPYWYFAVSVVFVILDTLEYQWISLVVKAFIISSLMGYYHMHTRGKYNLFSRLIMAGLFFSLAGDLILQVAGHPGGLNISADLFFMIGLIAFLVTHILYISAFIIPKGKNTLFSSRFYLILMILIYGVTMSIILYSHLGSMKIPVIIYTLVILVMLGSALNLYGKVNSLSYRMVSLGAACFVISDSMIALQKFHPKFYFGGFLIMGTYVIAQYLIVQASVRENHSPG